MQEKYFLWYCYTSRNIHLDTINEFYERSCKSPGGWIPFVLESHYGMNLNAFTEGRVNVSVLFVLVWRFGERGEVEIMGETVSLCLVLARWIIES